MESRSVWLQSLYYSNITNVNLSPCLLRNSEVTLILLVMFSYLFTKQLNLRVQEPRNKCAISSVPLFPAVVNTRMTACSLPLSPFLFLSPDFLPKQLYLRVKGQSLGISGVHHRGIRLKDDALSRGLQSCPTHGHQQIHHLCSSGHLLCSSGHDSQCVEGENAQFTSTDSWLEHGPILEDMLLITYNTVLIQCWDSLHIS